MFRKILAIPPGLCLFLFLGGCSAKETAVILPGAFQTGTYLPVLQGKSIALVVNQSSLINTVHLADSLKSLGVDIKKIFSPEHGFMGSADAGAIVHDEIHTADSIPVISLYGSRKKPAKTDLEGIDLILFDLQDVGVRVYTYISTLHYVMESCAENRIPVLILDRPNPNGFYVEGPVLKSDYRSFVGMHPVPFVHGMTIGEYALMINGEGWLKDSLRCDLRIIPCENYDHACFYELPVKPSPNLRNMQAVYLYPSLVLFEGTIVSIGRGTNLPFLVYGHPQYSQKDFRFIPSLQEGLSLPPKLEGQSCFGEDLSHLPLDSLRNKKFHLDYLLEMFHDLQTGDAFFIPYFDQLAGSVDLRKQILAGTPASEIIKSWKADLAEFKQIRAKYLLYPDF